VVGDFAFDDDGSYASCFDPCNGGEPPPKVQADGEAKLLCLDYPPPPTVITEYATRYKYYLNSVVVLGVCGYSRCSDQAFLSACPSSFTISTQSCISLGATQLYWITLWSNGFISCEKLGSPFLHSFIPPCSIP
jgi:hypothetical protein